jgi:hypothetical protein
MNTVCVDLNLTDLMPLNPQPVPNADTFIRIDVSFQTRAAELNYGFMNSTSWIPLNKSNILQQITTKMGNYSTAGVDSTDFSVSSQLVYALPSIQTVEYPPLKCL